MTQYTLNNRTKGEKKIEKSTQERKYTWYISATNDDTLYTIRTNKENYTEK